MFPRAIEVGEDLYQVPIGTDDDGCPMFAVFANQAGRAGDLLSRPRRRFHHEQAGGGLHERAARLNRRG